LTESTVISQGRNLCFDSFLRVQVVMWHNLIGASYQRTDAKKRKLQEWKEFNNTR
jgi:hypothetical protein